MSPLPIIYEIDVQIAITLASIGYLGEFCTIDQKRQKMSDALQQPDLPTKAQWSIVWGPAENASTYGLWYIAAGTDAHGDRSLAVVIRGTQMGRLESLKLDRELPLDPIPFVDRSAPAGARTSRGFNTEFTSLLAAIDGPSGLSGSQFLAKELSANPDLKVKVVGHSLGGATAPIMAMWLRSEFNAKHVRPFPFGGQSPGNAEFAKWYSDAFPKVPTRYVNKLDVCPLMFAELPQLKQMWGPEVECPVYVRDVVDAAEIYMLAERIEYAPTARAHVYDGTMYNVSGPWAWEHEASAQHEHFFYMHMAGIPLEVIRRGLGPGWAPPPGDGGCG
jgi:triacylglycerol lipase